MSTDLKTQIREYAVGVERDQGPITVDEIRLRLDRRDETQPVVGLRPPAESRPPVRAPWPALVAAAVVLIIFGVFVFVFPGDDPPPADTFPDPMDRETGYYVPTDVPDGFVLQDMEASQFGSSLLYLRDTGTTWLPRDGGLRISVPFGFITGLPENPEEFLGDIAQSSGASLVDVGGVSGVIRETFYVEGPVATPLVRLVVVDSRGGVFEIAASGMSQPEVLAVAERVERVPVDEFVSMGSGLAWDLQVSDTHEDFQYEVPGSIDSLATEVDVVLGPDVLSRTSLARAQDEETTVITTEDGSIVEPDDGPQRSWAALLYLDLPEEEVESAIVALQDERVRVSPQVSERLTDEYLDAVDGVLIAEDPFVIQAPTGPEPRFDPTELGEELHLAPAESLDEIPEDSLFRGRSENLPVATEERPVVVIGTVGQPGSDAEPLTMLLWFTDLPGMSNGLLAGEGFGSSGGSYPLERYGIGMRGTTQTEGSTDVFGEMAYSVPLETSVVQIVTDSASYWQRPAGGYGAISWGDTVDQPTSIVAYDARGVELGVWEVPAD